MPKIPVVNAYVKQLNLLNGASLTPDTLLFGKFNVGVSPNVGTVNFKGKPGTVLDGVVKDTFSAKRVALSDIVAKWVNPIPMLTTPNLYTALTRIGQRTGITFTTDDIEDSTITFDSNGLCTLTMQSKTGSLLCSGSAVVNFKRIANKQLSSIYTDTALDAANVIVGDADFLALANKENNVSLDIQSVTFSTPSTSNGNSAGNSVITLTGVPAYGIEGTVMLYFDRPKFSDLFPDLYRYSQTVWTGTIRTYVQTFFPEILTKINLAGIVDGPLTVGSTGKDEVVTITAVDGSYNVTGSTTIDAIWATGQDFARIRFLGTNVAFADMTASAVKQSFTRYLTPTINPATVRFINANYVETDTSASAVKQSFLRYVTPTVYSPTIRQIGVFYAVADTN